ncbi:MAG: transglutaminase-like cysteine peptidase [Methylococcaceae bacterium]|nr:transglutaminase-like cysteine peptidase [Methylococcaceae bacterium]
MAVGFIYTAILVGVVTSLFSGTAPREGFRLDRAQLDRIEGKYGPDARRRFADWQGIMASGKTAPEPEKLRQVNDFFNQNIRFVDDLTLWLKDDYWATPFELLAKGAGDCEDFSIAKYFTLLEMGVAENKLRITYVKALELNQAHMVLTYFESPLAVPLVLDNLKPAISLATDRGDLQPVYSFNGSGLWLAKAKGSGRQVGAAERLNPWADLKRRMIEKAF